MSKRNNFEKTIRSYHQLLKDIDDKKREVENLRAAAKSNPDNKVKLYEEDLILQRMILDLGYYNECCVPHDERF